jgi:hypothetical protein
MSFVGRVRGASVAEFDVANSEHPWNGTASETTARKLPFDLASVSLTRFTSSGSLLANDSAMRLVDYFTEKKWLIQLLPLQSSRC